MTRASSLTVSQVAEQLGVHPKTIYRLVEQGRLPAIKVGRLWRIPATALADPEQTVHASASNGTMLFAEAGTAGTGTVPVPATLLQQAVDAAPVLLSYVDAQHCYRFVNHAYEQWFGRPRHRVVGHHLRDVLGDDAYNAIRPYIDAALAGERISYERTVPYRDGGPRVIRATYVPHRASDNGVSGFFAFVQDITEHDRAAAAMRASEARYRELWEHANDVLYTLDLDGRLTDVNRQAERLTGYTRAELLGRPISDLVFPANHDAMRHVLARKMAGEPVTTYELALQTKDGGTRVVEVSSRLLHNTEGWPVGIQGSARDITDRVKMEDALRRSEQDLTDFFENGAVGLHWVGPDGTILRVNQAELNLLGYTRDEYIGRHIADFHVDQHVITDILARLSRGETLHEVPARMRAKDGSIKHVLIDSNVLWEDGRFIHTRCFTRDVTDRIAAEGALRETATARDATLAELEAVLASVAEAITAQDPSGRLVYANAAAARLLGYSSVEDLLAAPVAEVMQSFELLDEDGHPFPATQLPGQRVLRGEPASEAVVRFRIRATGEERWSVVRATPVADASGSVRLAVNAFQDITSLRQADELQRRLAAIVTSSEDAIISKTLDAIITSWNHAAERMYGYTEHEAIGQPIAMLVPPDRPDELSCIMATLRRGEHISHYETERIRKDGVRLAVALTISPIRDRSGRLIGASTIARDITAQKRAEAEREQLLAREQAALAEARAALAVRDEFVASISHDLRTPLSSIKGLTQLMQRRMARLDHPDRLRFVEQLTTVDRSAARMQAMIDELLDIARLQSGRPLELSRQAVDLVALVQQRVADFERSAPRHQMRVVTAIPALVGHWDAARLERVLDNLLSNAIKYSPEGGPVTVSVRAVGNDAGGTSWAEVAVADCGVGIPAADLPHIFERFHRGANVAGRVGGAGIGLAGVQRIIELHGGSVNVTSTEGEGTTVTVLLPLADMEYEGGEEL